MKSAMNCQKLESYVNGNDQGESKHDAIERKTLQHKPEPRHTALRQAYGMWEGRDDLPDFAEIRTEWNRTIHN